jgi:hypothetical protein
MDTLTKEPPSRLELKKVRACWHHMLDRCHNEKCGHYAAYGGRGIFVCSEWRTDAKAFIGWALDNGFKLGLTIDRRENDMGYSPGNCRWVPRSVNQQNRRKPVGSLSKFTGIYPSKNGQKWEASIQKDGKRRYIGSFITEEDAARAYDAEALKEYGPHAKLNFPVVSQ